MRVRPARLVAVTLLAAGLALAGCGSATTDSAAPSTTDEGTVTSSPSVVIAGPATDPFPVTVEHQFGRTTVPADPQRVVSVGLTEQDVLLELGVIPVATTEWYGDQPQAVWPWARDLLGDARPEVLEGREGPSYERIAALRPDLIIGTNAGMTREQYDLLSRIAPTVTSVSGSEQYFSSWQDQTRQIARAVGRSAAGDALVDRVEQRYAEVRAEHPQFAGLTATFSQGAPYDGELYVYPDGVNTDFLTELGFTITPGLEKFQPSAGEQAQIPAESVDAIDADVIVFASESQQNFDELQEWSTIGSLPVVQQNRAVYADETLAGAIYFLTPLSQQYVLDRLPAALDQAVAGQAPRAYGNAA